MGALRTQNKIKGGNFVNLIIIQYIPVNIMLFPCKQIEIKNFYLIARNLLCNPICAQNYDDKQFFILAKGRSPFIHLRSHFHQNLKLNTLPTKRICLQSHAALALINPLFSNFPRHSI